MSLILTSRPQIKAIPRNESAPLVNPRIQETLTRIGGIVPPSGGPFAGQPVYRLGWGQSETHFCRGKERIRFTDDDIEMIFVQERFFVAPEVFARAAAWQELREKSRLERFLNFDYTIFAETQPIGDYLKQNESSLDYMPLEDATGTREEVSMDVLGIATTVAPHDWLYLCDVKEIIEIGKACWFVMRWIPGSSIGGRDHWNRLRYSRDAYVPELNGEVPLIDDLGPFPDFGCYVPRFQIAEFLEDETGELSQTEFRYTEPTTENCIQPVVEEIYERAQLTNQDKNREWRSKENEQHLLNQRDRRIAEKRRAADQLLGLNETPVMDGKIHVFQS